MKNPIMWTDDIEKIIKNRLTDGGQMMLSESQSKLIKTAANDIQNQLTINIKGEDIGIGSVVKLPSGSPEMTVIADDSISGIKLAWFENGVMHEMYADKKALLLSDSSIDVDKNNN